VYDHPASPFVLQFLGDVNLFHGRLDSDGGVSSVRPHELEVTAEPDDATWPVTLSQTLTVGPNTRIEFKREGPGAADGGYVDVELTRTAYAALRQRVNLAPGAKLRLRPRRFTRFEEGAGI
jgi:sulfate transport system ATP-binding protein